MVVAADGVAVDEVSVQVKQLQVTFPHAAPAHDNICRHPCSAVQRYEETAAKNSNLLGYGYKKENCKCTPGKGNNLS